MQYQITSKSGEDHGIYEGGTEAHALLAMHSDAGYGPDRVWIENGILVCDTAETLTTIGGVDDWIIEEVHVTLADLTAELREIDCTLAPGSSTHVWGEFIDRMIYVMGVHPTDEKAAMVVIPDAEAAWWRNAYKVLAAKPDWTFNEIADAIPE